MNKEELRKKFIVGADVLKDRLEPLVTKALQHCKVVENGIVHVTSNSLGAKEKIKLVLTARSLAAQLDDDMSAEMRVSELVASTGFPDNQIRARCNELVKERFARSVKRGVFVANAHKIEEFLNSLPSNS